MSANRSHFAAINRAIKHTGLKLRAGRGYYYFVSRSTGDQIGESEYVYRCEQLPIERWIVAAERRTSSKIGP